MNLKTYYLIYLDHPSLTIFFEFNFWLFDPRQEQVLFSLVNMRIFSQFSSRVWFDLFSWQSRISPFSHIGKMFWNSVIRKLDNSVNRKRPSPSYRRCFVKEVFSVHLIISCSCIITHVCTLSIHLVTHTSISWITPFLWNICI